MFAQIIKQEQFVSFGWIDGWKSHYDNPKKFLRSTK